MQIERTSILSGITRTKDIDITQAQFDAWEAGMLIQNACPHLSDSDREFMISGITEEEWGGLFGPSK